MSYFEDWIEPNIGNFPKDKFMYDKDYYKYWTTAKNEVLLIDTMETPHLMNCLKLMVRRNQQSHPTYQYIKDILISRNINVK